MPIQWINSKKKDGIATFSSGAITLNTTAMSPLKEYLYVMVGCDKDKKSVVIKTIDYNLTKRGDLDVGLLYKLSINSSYGRITSKDVIENIEETFKIKVDGKKYSTNWDEDNSSLIISMDKEVK